MQMNIPPTSARKKQNVFLVTSQPMLAQRLAGLIQGQPDWSCCEPAANLARALSEISHKHPDLILLDVAPENGDELSAIKELKSAAGGVRILVISELDETIHAERVLRAGASGFVMSDRPDSEVIQAIRAVLGGEWYASEKVTTLALQRIICEKPTFHRFNLAALTDRELHVLKSVGAGKGNKQIAGEMNLSVKTIETYREHLKYKLGLNNSARLVEYAEQWTRDQLFDAAAGSGREGMVPHPVTN